MISCAESNPGMEIRIKGEGGITGRQLGQALTHNIFRRGVKWQDQEH